MSIETVLTQLQASIASGEEKVSDWVTIDQSRINLFADATDDHQWIHVDPERASAESPFKGPIAHGYLTLSLIPALSGSVREGGSGYPGVRMGVNYGLNKVRFPAPVPSGARVRLRQQLKEVSEIPGGLQLVNLNTIEVEGGEKPCCVAETVSRLYF